MLYCCVLHLSVARTVPSASLTSREANSQGREGKLTLKLILNSSPCALLSTTICDSVSGVRKELSSCMQRVHSAMSLASCNLVRC